MSWTTSKVVQVFVGTYINVSTLLLRQEQIVFLLFLASLNLNGISRLTVRDYIFQCILNQFILENPLNVSLKSVIFATSSIPRILLGVTSFYVSLIWLIDVGAYYLKDQERIFIFLWCFQFSFCITEISYREHWTNYRYMSSETPTKNIWRALSYLVDIKTKIFWRMVSAYR